MLKAGSRISHYEVVAQVGSGGMGVVYCARDERLEREVAIKVLPAEVASDPDRLARFEREAKALAKLSHPNILVVHEVGVATLAVSAAQDVGAELASAREPFAEDGRGTTIAQRVHFLVTELLEGETLRERVQSGAVSWREAVKIGAAVADGLAAAHAQGIVHRDLKPENVIIASDGAVKILDFGLARVTAPTFGDAETVTAADGATMPGTVLGTVGYMAPEQVRGEQADQRADIFAHGCVLYEMLAGQRAFSGDTPADTLSAILTKTPSALAESDTALPAGLSGIVGRCLEKEPQQRFQSASDLAFALRSVAGASAAVRPQAEVGRPLRWKRAAAVAMLPLVAAALAVVVARNLWRAPPAPRRPPARLALTLPEGDRLSIFSPLAISPGGRRVVFALHRGETQRLFWREIGDWELHEIPGTEGAGWPFFSPDGNWVGFSVPFEQKLKKVSLLGGNPQDVCTCAAMDASWGEDGTIVFAGLPGGLRRVPASGGEAEPLTSADVNFEPDEALHYFPHILPGGRAVLFSATDGTQKGRIVLLSLETGERRTLIERGTNARYASTGHLVYALPAHGDLLAAPFDLAALRVTGEPLPVLEGVRTNELGGAFYALSSGGTLVYASGGGVSRRRPVWVDHAGSVEVLPFAPAYYHGPRVAPDGRWLGATLYAEGASVVLLDPVREIFRRLTDDRGSEFWMVWHPDGRGVVYSSLRPGTATPMSSLYRGSVSGDEPEVLLHEGRSMPSGWTSDGRTLLFQERGLEPEGGFDIWELPLDGEARPLLAGPFNETHSLLSPDGRWLAYVSDESGQYELCVRSYPGLDQFVQVSSGGGFEPLWSPDGATLYFRRPWDGGTVLASLFRGEPTPVMGKARILFELEHADGSPRFDFGNPFGRSWDISPDGRRFLMLELAPEPPSTHVNLILDWFQELERLVSSGGRS